VIELFSTVTFLRIKDGGGVSVIARQQTYCASNLEQGGGEVPVPSGEFCVGHVYLLDYPWKKGLFLVYLEIEP